MILGLDASTSVCGWCILNDQDIIKAGHATLSTKGDLYQRLRHLQTALHQLFQQYPITRVVIEAPAKMFNARSSANTMSLLQRWNGMVCAAISLRFNIDAELIEPATARKHAGIAIKKGEKAKEQVVQHLQRLDVLPAEAWQLKRTGKLKDWCYDVADACVVAMAAQNAGNQKQKEP